MPYTMTSLPMAPSAAVPPGVLKQYCQHYTTPEGYLKFCACLKHISDGYRPVIPL